MTQPACAGRRLAAFAALLGTLLLLLAPSANATTLMTEDMAVFGGNPTSALANKGYVAAHHLGARMIRYHRGLNVNEPDYFNAYFQRVDAWLASVEAQGLTPYLAITYQPDTYDGNQDPSPTDFGNWCEAIATRYGSRIRDYSVWNEPNNSSGGPFLYQDTGYYNQLYRSCYAEIKAVSAANKVYYGEIDAHIVSSCAWVENAVNNGGTTYADGIALHTYQWKLAPEQQYGGTCQGIGRLGDWQNWIASWQQQGKLRNPSGGQVPILITEHGYCPDWGECPPGAASQYNNRINDENVRADYARRAFLWAQSHGVKVFSYYHLINLATGDPLWDTGIMGLNGQWSPTVYALHDAVVGPGPSKAAVSRPGSGSFFFRDPATSTIRQRYWNTATQTWASQVLGGSAAGEPTSYVAGDNVYVYFRGTDGAIWQWLADNNAWHLTRIGGSAAGDPIAYRYPSGVAHAVYFRGTDNAIWQVQWQSDNQSWNVGRLGGSATGDPTAYMANGNHFVYFRGTNGAIWQWQWQLDNQSWNITQLGGSAAGDPTALVAGTSHVVYFRGTNGSISQWQWRPENPSWNLTQLGSSATGDPTAYVADGNRYVYFRATNGAIWQWQLDNSVWSLTELAGGSAATDPSAYSADGHHAVFFRGTNGGIYLHFWSPLSGQWSLNQI